MSEWLVGSLALAIVVVVSVFGVLSLAVVGLAVWMLLRWLRAWGQPHELAALRETAPEPRAFFDALRARGEKAPESNPEKQDGDGPDLLSPASDMLRAHQSRVADAEVEAARRHMG
jgi:hypothetical protein